MATAPSFFASSDNGQNCARSGWTNPSVKQSILVRHINGLDRTKCEGVSGHQAWTKTSRHSEDSYSRSLANANDATSTPAPGKSH